MALTKVTSGAVSGLATSATTDTTDASNITTGTIPTARLDSTLDLSGKTVTLPAASVTAHATNPTKASIEALGIDASTLTGSLPAIDGSALTGVDAVITATAAPGVGSAGALFYNTTEEMLYVSNGTIWVAVYDPPKDGSTASLAPEYGSDIIALGLPAGLYWLTGKVSAAHTPKQVYVDSDGWMLMYRHAGTGGSYNSTYEIIGDTLGEAAVGTLTSPTQGLTDAGSSTTAGSRGVARLATDFIRSLGGDSATNNVYRITTGSVTSYITDAQWWSTSNSADGYGLTTISTGTSYAGRRTVTNATPDARPMGSYHIGGGDVIPWYHGNGYSGGYNPSEHWHIACTVWVREY